MCYPLFMFNVRFDNLELKQLHMDGYSGSSISLKMYSRCKT